MNRNEIAYLLAWKFGHLWASEVSPSECMGMKWAPAKISALAEARNGGPYAGISEPRYQHTTCTGGTRWDLRTDGSVLIEVNDRETGRRLAVWDSRLTQRPMRRFALTADAWMRLEDIHNTITDRGALGETERAHVGIKARRDGDRGA